MTIPENQNIEQEKDRQQKILDELLAENMRRIVTSRSLFGAVVKLLQDEFPERLMNGKPDGFLGVGKGTYGTRLPNGEWDEGIEYSVYEKEEVSSVHMWVARISSLRSGEYATTFQGDFNPGLLQEVIELTEPLELARTSGLLPNLTPHLDRIYVPRSEEATS